MLIALGLPGPTDAQNAHTQKLHAKRRKFNFGRASCLRSSSIGNVLLSRSTPLVNAEIVESATPSPDLVPWLTA